MTAVKLLLGVLAVLLAARAHMTFAVAGHTATCTALPYFATVVLAPCAAFMLAAHRAMKRNRYPRFCWLAGFA